MGRVTRAEAAVCVGTGLLLGALVALAGQWLRLPLAAQVAICVVWAFGLAAALAQRKGGPR